VQSTDTIKVEFATTAYPNNWTDASNVVSLALDSTGDATKSAGFTVASGSATTTVVTFNRYKTLANDDAPAVDWANTMMWRVRKVSGGASVGYPISSANIVGRTDGVAPAAGMVGHETRAVETASQNCGASGVQVDGVFFNLDPGVYDISGVCTFDLNGATSTAVYLGISSTSGNSTTGLVYGDNWLETTPPTAGAYQSISIPQYRVIVSTTTRYNLKISATYSAGTVKYRACRMSAIRR
jgi:hypothetical protein